jgi:hypothetical protein
MSIFDASCRRSRRSCAVTLSCRRRGASALVAVWSVTALTTVPLAAAEAQPAGGWTETFDDGSWVERWVPYGRLADGTWAQGVDGHWPKGPKTVFARGDWWQLEDGAIRGRNFPDEKHPAGLKRREKLSPRFQASGIRVRCRVRVGDTSTAQIRIGGSSPGIKPDEATDRHVAVVDVRATGIRFWNGNRVLVAEEPAAEPGGKPKQQTKNTVLEQVSERPITPDEWHDVVFEVKGHDVRVAVDGVEAVTYRLPHVQPLQSFGLAVNGDKQSIGTAWFDEVVVDALPESGWGS